jgi:hypothetical protein
VAAPDVLQQPSQNIVLKDGLGLSLNDLGGDVPWAVLGGAWNERFVIV